MERHRLVFQQREIDGAALCEASSRAFCYVHLTPLLQLAGLIQKVPSLHGLDRAILALKAPGGIVFAVDGTLGLL